MEFRFRTLEFKLHYKLSTQINEALRKPDKGKIKNTTGKSDKLITLIIPNNIRDRLF
jgi:hypothetical protein